jgi:glucose/mannose-6-phosphate isomerase
VEVPTASNIAKQLARSLKDRLVVIHAAADHLEAVAMRWKGQLNENAKVLAFHSLYPELDHNEVVGWTGPGAQAAGIHVIALRDAADDPRTQRRIETTSEMILGAGAQVSQVWSGQGGLLPRMFGLIHLGDYVSVYLGVLGRVDPTPVETIDRIKARLAEATAAAGEVAPRG